MDLPLYLKFNMTSGSLAWMESNVYSGVEEPQWKQDSCVQILEDL